jgi:hypothetical protein
MKQKKKQNKCGLDIEHILDDYRILETSRNNIDCIDSNAFKIELTT